MNPPLSLLPEIAAYLRRGRNVRKVEVPRIEDLPAPLREAAERLPGITGAWNPVEIYTAEPRSLRQEKQKFLAAYGRGRVYEPSFRYDYAEEFQLGDSRQVLQALLEKVRACETADRAAKLTKLIFFFKIKDDLATCDLVEGIQRKDERLIRDALEYKYPGVDPLIYEYAEKDFQRLTAGEQAEAGDGGTLAAEEKQYLRTLTFDAPAVKEAFEWALRQYDILWRDDRGSGYRVTIDRRTTAIDVRDKSRLGPAVFVPETTRETGERLLGLIAHEIEGHARQSWNGERLFIFGGGPLKIDEETLYEGLAMRYETEFRSHYFGAGSTARNMDFYVFAVHRAEAGGSFYDVFHDQMDKRLRVKLRIPPRTGFSPGQVKDSPAYERVLESAWGCTYRAMRGHTDMKNPCGYAMAKDLAYFRGWILDHQLRESGHGHINEASICSIGQLRVLAEFHIREEQIPAPYKDVASQYLKMLLAKRTASPSFSAKRRSEKLS